MLGMAWMHLIKKQNYANFIDHLCYSNIASGCRKGLYFSLYDIGKDAGIQILVALTEQDKLTSEIKSLANQLFH